MAPAARHRLKIMTYNIHHANPPSKKEGIIDLNAIAAVIIREKPDLVALQEVDVNTERSGKGSHQARELAQLTGMHYYFSKAIDHQGGDYGVAVLSRFPIIDSLTYPLPVDAAPGGEPRTLCAVKVQYHKKKTLWFASTHLDLKEPNRIAQAERIVNHFASVTEPVILGGDFNALIGSPVIDRLDRHFTRTCSDCAPTSPMINPRRTIDFIMFRSRISALSTRVIDEQYASDHLPVVAELEIR